VQRSGRGARLVEIGDPRQSQAVGAAGLWPELERVAEGQGAKVELSRIVRARSPEHRRDQALFRSGQHERALEGCGARGCVVLEADLRRAQDSALEGAHADRAVGKQSLVICQPSMSSWTGSMPGRRRSAPNTASSGGTVSRSADARTTFTRVMR